MILLILPILLLVGAVTVIGTASALIGRKDRASRQKTANNILPLNRSGNNCYPASHDVFTSNSQDNLSWVTVTPTNLNFNNHLNNLPNGDYRNAIYGSEYIRLLSYHIAGSGPDQSIRRALVNVSNEVNDRLPNPFDRLHTAHIPLYRLGNNQNVDTPERDFEVLFITGTPDPDNTDDRFNASMLEHSIRRTHGNRCREFQMLHNPNRAELEASIIARTQSARRNNRRLYIVYSGHGNYAGTQAGVAAADLNMQGSRRFVFGLNRIAGGFTEDDYKNLLNLHASNIEVTSIVSACFSGAAVTADDPFFRRSIGSV